MIRISTRRNGGSGIGNGRKTTGTYADKQDRKLVRLHHSGDAAATAELNRRVKRGRFIVGF